MKRIVVAVVPGRTTDAVLSLLVPFQATATRGNRAAAEFLRTGSHTAWRRVDGSLFRDPDFAGVRP